MLRGNRMFGRCFAVWAVSFCLWLPGGRQKTCQSLMTTPMQRMWQN